MRARPHISRAVLAVLAAVVPAPTVDGSGAYWQRIRLTVQEMNYSARRIVEAQAPSIVDEKPHSR